LPPLFKTLFIALAAQFGSNGATAVHPPLPLPPFLRAQSTPFNSFLLGTTAFYLYIHKARYMCKGPRFINGLFAVFVSVPMSRPGGFVQKAEKKVAGKKLTEGSRRRHSQQQRQRSKTKGQKKRDVTQKRGYNRRISRPSWP
jgi:hypothetical protein